MAENELIKNFMFSEELPVIKSHITSIIDKNDMFAYLYKMSNLEADSYDG